jgi:citrate lyase subunit beta / citryl-CoA lyase
MIARSLLFVPGDSDRKLAKCETAQADIVILDLEDSVAPDQKSAARARVGEFVRAHPARTGPQLWVRINALDTSHALADLASLAGSRPDGIVQPKIHSADDVLRLAEHLDAYESQHRLERGHIRILPLATETAQSVFSLGDYSRCGPRLYGLTWGAEDLSAVVGASANRQPDGSWTHPYQLVRSLCLFGAAAAGVPAIDTVHADFRDARGLEAACHEARRDGFVGKLAIHPDQVPIINASFTPSEEEIARATRVVALFQDHPGVATLALDGQMLDLPHLRQAQRILARARALRP